MGCGCLGQGKQGDFGDAHGSRFYQRDDALKMKAVSTDLRPESLYIVSRRLRRPGAGSNKRGSSTRLQHGKGTLGHVTAHGIEHDVAIGHHLGEILGVVIDDLVGTKVAQIIVVRRAGRRDHTRPYMLGELDGEAGDAARPTLDQDHLAGLEL